MAYHFERARDPRSVEWLIAAGERAEEDFAPATAAQRYEAALTLLDARGGDAGRRGWLALLIAVLRILEQPLRSPDSLAAAGRLAVEADDPRLAARVRSLQGVLLSQGGAIRRGLAELGAGVAALDALPPADKTRDGIEARVAAIAGHGTLILTLAYSGHLAAARKEGEQYLASRTASAASTVGDGALLAVWRGLGSVYAMLGEVERARHAFAALLEVYGAIANRRYVRYALRDEIALVTLPMRADDPAERGRMLLLVEREVASAIDTSSERPSTESLRYPQLPLLLLEGRWPEARRIAEAIPEPHIRNQWYLRHWILGVLARARGEPERAWALVREMLPDGPATEPGDMLVTYVAPMQRLAAALALDAADHMLAKAWLKAHDRWLAWMNAVVGRSEGEALWAAYERVAGNLDDAYTHAERALTHATTPRQPLALLAAHRLLGELDTQAGRHGSARQHLDASLALAVMCAAPFERALTLFGLAELQRATGDADAALATLADVSTICLSLDAKPALARAVALARRIRPRQGDPTAHAANLSEREAEVLRLLADGLTNVAIADRLFISRYTVKRHVSNILTKLDVTTRAAAIRFALEHDLT